MSVIYNPIALSESLRLDEADACVPEAAGLRNHAYSFRGLYHQDAKGKQCKSVATANARSGIDTKSMLNCITLGLNYNSKHKGRERERENTKREGEWETQLRARVRSVGAAIAARVLYLHLTYIYIERERKSRETQLRARVRSSWGRRLPPV